jgi:hypothetical protein
MLRDTEFSGSLNTKEWQDTGTAVSPTFFLVFQSV